VSGGTSHLDLMALAGVIGNAARNDDVDGVHVALCQLRNDLVEHVASESDAVAGMSDAAAGPVRNGHRRLLIFIDDLLADPGGVTGCSCVVRAAELRALLMRQIRLEGSLASRQRVQQRPEGTLG